LARRILDLVNDETAAAAMGRRGRQRVEDSFTFAAQALQYQRVFERLCHKQPSPVPEPLAVADAAAPLGLFPALPAPLS
jgi:hypothetical protein